LWRWPIDPTGADTGNRCRALLPINLAAIVQRSIDKMVEAKSETTGNVLWVVQEGSIEMDRTINIAL